MIRAATSGDAAALAAIYAPHVLTGTASFETEPPEPAEMAARLGRVLAHGWPWLVWEADGALWGYAYATQFRDRPAYHATCENSIYVAAGSERQGVGRGLLAALVTAAREAGFAQMVAVIGDGTGNQASVGLHRACGFADAGRLVGVGHKFGRWLDVVYMQRGI